MTEFKIKDYRIKIFDNQKALVKAHGVLPKDKSDPNGLHAFYNPKKKQLNFTKDRLTSPYIVHEIVHMALRSPSFGDSIDDDNEEQFCTFISDFFFELVGELQARGYKV